MTEVKFFEIRDEGTHVPAMCVKIDRKDIRENYQMYRAGFNVARDQYILTNLNTLETRHNPYEWTRFRTMGNAHEYISVNWEYLDIGDVIDIQFILGETLTKKTSERRQ